MSTVEKPDFVVINAISRSGGTFLNALFEGEEDFQAFPIEFPLIKGQAGLGFVSPEEFAEIRSPADLLDRMDLDYHLSMFSSQPYVRSLGRRQRAKELTISFEYREFRSLLDSAYPDFDSIGNAYQWIWQTFFQCITINGVSAKTPLSRISYVNHFANNVVRPYGVLAKNAESICNLYLIHIIRDPLENIASLKCHWPNVSNDPQFVKLAWARWEMYLHSAMRNRALHPGKCEIIVYDHDISRLKEQFSRSPLPSLIRLAATQPAPTILGIPLSGQSYKESRGESVTRNYDYSTVFSAEELSYLRSNIEKAYGAVGIQHLADLEPGSTAGSRCQLFAKVEDRTYDLFLQRFSEAVSFAPSFEGNFRANVTSYMKQANLLSPRKLLRGLMMLRRLI